MYFSIVVPLYNKERHIERAIESVLAQNFTDFELIIVNDGSTDESVDRTYRYTDKRIKVFNQDNSGEGAARNKGISLAKANYIAFLDADDFWRPCFLTDIYQLIHELPDFPLYGSAYEVQEKTGELARYGIVDIKNIIGEGRTLNFLKCLAHGVYPVYSSSVCIRRDAFTAVGLFDPKLKIGADIDMWIRLGLLGPFGYTTKVGATYHRDADHRACERNDFHARRIEFLQKQAILYSNWSGSMEDRANLSRYISREAYSELHHLFSSTRHDGRYIEVMNFPASLYRHITLWQRAKLGLKFRVAF
jgi:glycosyltransferase involved in cell wall biosynthesis